MSSTQEHIPIEDILDNVVITKQGTMAIILQTSAVNFGLLSENEQLAIIEAFAGMLNSLSFAIQIVIRSKRLNITSYLKQLDEARAKQTNPLMIQMINQYQNFIRNTIQENDVLDKQFYIIVPISSLEVGIVSDIKSNFKKALTLLVPRRDHIIRQLARIGLKATQLETAELVKLFYDIYNASDEETAQQVVQPTPSAAQPTIPVIVSAQQNNPSLGPSGIVPQPPIAFPTGSGQASNYPHQIPSQNYPSPGPMSSRASSGATPPNVSISQPVKYMQTGSNEIPRRNKPFVVEELPDDYGTV